MQWASLISENFGAVVGVIGTVVGVALGALIEQLRTRSDRSDRSRMRVGDRRLAAHEQMLEALSRATALVGRTGVVVDKPTTRADALRRVLDSADAMSAMFDAVHAGYARVALHSPDTARLCLDAVNELLVAGAVAGLVAGGTAERKQLDDRLARARSARDAYSKAAAKELAAE